jgi:hypothetical protein
VGVESVALRDEEKNLYFCASKASEMSICMFVPVSKWVLSVALRQFFVYVRLYH